MHPCNYGFTNGYISIQIDTLDLVQDVALLLLFGLILLALSFDVLEIFCSLTACQIFQMFCYSAHDLLALRQLNPILLGFF